MYLHPDRNGITCRICKLLGEQKQDIVNLLLYDGDAPAPSPLPILPGRNNIDRVDPEEPISETGVYRDLWERKDRPVTREDFRLRDVYSRNDWPGGIDDKTDSGLRARRRQYAQQLVKRAAEDAQHEQEG